MPQRLTDTAITKALRDAAQTNQRRDLADVGQPGLRLRVTPSGATTWVLACRDLQGRMRRFGLGAYPTLGLSAARSSARALHYKVRHQGADPTADRRAARARTAEARDGTGTLTALLDLYTRQVGSKQRAWSPSRRVIERVFRHFLSRPLAALRLADLQLTADSYQSQTTASLAVRCLRPVLKWASVPGRGYVASELTQIRPPAAVQRRTRVLDRAELARLLPALTASARPYAAAMRLLLLTLLRLEEVCGARWRDLDWPAGTLTIAAERSKNAQPHVVPLPRQAIALLQQRLPAAANPAGLIFTTGRGGQLQDWNSETKAVQAASGTEGWTRHDLRRTGATLLGELGELPDIVEAALNHASIRSPLAATYNRSRYRPQVAAALQRLADLLDSIEHGGAAIVPLAASV